ncbi:MAG: nuclear transport factor 2 family protein [Fuerstiella sp.]
MIAFWRSAIATKDRVLTAGKVHQFVLNLQHSVWQAVVGKDGAALSELFADGYIEVTLDGKRVARGTVVSESPVIDEIAGYSIDAERVVCLNEGCILLSYHLTIDGTSRGVKISPPERWATSVWSRQDGSWKCSLFQQSVFGPDHKAKAV